MLTHPTLDRLNTLGLHGMAKAFVDIEATGEAATLGHAEWLALLLEREASLRHDKRLAARHDLLEILEDRYGRRSTLVTSQLPVDQWHALIGDPTYADAVLDRLVHNAHRIDLAGESLRRTRPSARKV